jgi:hypothetical protein
LLDVLEEPQAARRRAAAIERRARRVRFCIVHFLDVNDYSN